MKKISRSFPPEWSPQHAVLLTWPHKKTDWEDIIDDVIELYVKLAIEILKRQHLIISCTDQDRIADIKSALAPYSRNGYSVSIYHIASNDTWARDHGPVTVYEKGHAKLIDFEFNAWGNKFPSDLDNLITRKLYQNNAFSHYKYMQSGLILEGGSIESNGEGVLMTTSKCLLAPSRNPGLNKQSLTDTLREQLGIEEILWLDHGYLAGDDTDSHIDTLARFCKNDLICYVKCDDPDDEHYNDLLRMEGQLKSFTQRNGEPYRLEALPLPDAIISGGQRLPATYANFLIINGAVLVPIYGVKQDNDAITVLERCFPTHEITPINCQPLIQQHGSLHCITMQIPMASYSATY